MGKCLDLVGNKYGKLTVLKRLENDKNNKSRWLCQCDCGNECISYGSDLKRGHTKSCGCYKPDLKKYNTYDLSGNYGVGYTSKGQEFYFDLEDYNKIKDYCWSINGNGYVIYCSGGNVVIFHRLVMNCPEDKDVDHIHGSKTNNDNRKSNLRICSHHKNTMNRKYSANTSGCVGVCFDKRKNKWLARIKVNYKDIYLGYYKDFDEAVKVRKEAEEKYFGEYSYDNSQRM